MEIGNREIYLTQRKKVSYDKAIILQEVPIEDCIKYQLLTPHHTAIENYFKGHPELLTAYLKQAMVERSYTQPSPAIRPTKSPLQPKL